MISSRKIKKALLIQAPGSDKKGIFAPIGLLSVSKILQEQGIQVTIIDMCIDDKNILAETAVDISPDLIGFGGIASSYSSTKELSEILHRYCPDSIYVAGGILASIYEILLEDKIVDFVFHGEVENSLPKFIKFLETESGLNDIGGVSFLKEKLMDCETKENFVNRTENHNRIGMTFPEVQVENLDNCGFPDYSLIDLNRYILDLRNWYSYYKPTIEKSNILKNKCNELITQGKYKYIELIATSRGCTHKCIFCYRHMKGIRRYGIEYVITNIKLLIERCLINGISFADELFNSDEKWIYELCDALDRENLGLSFYMAGAMRADKINEDLIRRMAKTGFIALNFGQESGSDTILKYYRKGVSRQQNIDSVLLTDKYGIFTCAQLVIGSPAESMKTIKETKSFLKSINAYQASINYIIPLPGTPLWEVAIKNGYIKNIRKYLDKVKECAGSYYLGLNMSKANKVVWIFWYIFLERIIFLNRYKNSLLKKIYYGMYFFKVSSLIKKGLLQKVGIRK